MKCQELEPSIRRHGVAPIYLIVGEEDYLRDQATASIKAAVLGADGSDGFNCDLFYGDECTAADILSCVSDLPVFAERRLVLVKAVEKLPARETEQLIPYLKAPNESTTLVFVTAKLDGRLKFTQSLKQTAAVVDCGPLPTNQVSGWVRAQASQLGLQLSDDAVPLIAELASHSLNLVRRELEKLAVSVAQGKVAGAADVDAVRGTESGASVFDLSAAIAAGDRSRVLRIVVRNLEAGEAPLRMLGSLVWQYRRLWKAQALLQRGSSDADIGRALGIPPFRLREFLRQVRLFSEPHFRSAFRWFLETDSALKGGKATAPERTLESLLLRLCFDAKGAPTAGEAKKASVPSPQASRPGRTKPISTVRTIRSGLT